MWRRTSKNQNSTLISVRGYIVGTPSTLSEGWWPFQQLKHVIIQFQPERGSSIFLVTRDGDATLVNNFLRKAGSGQKLVATYDTEIRMWIEAFSDSFTVLQSIRYMTGDELDEDMKKLRR